MRRMEGSVATSGCRRRPAVGRTHVVHRRWVERDIRGIDDLLIHHGTVFAMLIGGAVALVPE